jgi:hypothetical protein
MRTRSSRSSHERRRPTGPAVFTGELGLPGSTLRDCSRRDNTRYHPSFFSPAIHPFFLLGNLGGRARHSTRSLSGVYSRSMMLLLGKFGAPPGMLIYNGRRATDAPASTRSPSLACRLCTRQHPHQPHVRGWASAQIADSGSRGGARMQCCFRGFSAVPTPQDSGPPLHVCMLTDVRSNRALGCPSRVSFVCHRMRLRRGVMRKPLRVLAHSLLLLIIPRITPYTVSLSQQIIDRDLHC